MAKQAILVCDGGLAGEQLRLARILDFFGVPWKSIEVAKPPGAEAGAEEQVWFGTTETVAAALEQTQGHALPTALYVYMSRDRGASERGLQSLCGSSDIRLRQAPAGDLRLRVSPELAAVAGPMAGVEVQVQLRQEDAILQGAPAQGPVFDTVLSAGDDPVFVRLMQRGIPTFVCASSYMPDIDQAVGAGFYDIKDHFCSAVPLVMFIRLMFKDVAWEPAELGACLIIDDPLLRARYGACDFRLLRNLMRQYGFTTNIAFIPWNWRRTSPHARDFFGSEPGSFSVSVHGCDHIGAEFGSTSPTVLNARARLAQSRMRSHGGRTGIHHDPVMVFPQGVFSSVCPKVLKRNGFLAAANTEIVPTDSAGVQTCIRDVWDVAMMRYGDFPIFTRRYAHHGVENFAFDCLLGKPCLIVAHHEFFKDNCAGLIDLLEKLDSLNCNLSWRPLGDVMRRACRRRFNEAGVEEVEMYGNELLLDNPFDRELKVLVQKREAEPDVVAEVRCDDQPISWTSKAGHIVFAERVGPRSEKRFQVLYREQAEVAAAHRSLRFELKVACRRILSEFRDEFLSRSGYLSSTATALKTILTGAR